MVRMLKGVLGLMVAAVTIAQAKPVEVPIDVTIGSVDGLVGDVVSVPVNLTSGPLVADDGVLSYQFEIQFDRTVLEPVGVDFASTFGAGRSTANNIANDLLVNPGNDILRLAVAGDDSMTGSLPFAFLRFEVVGAPGSEGALSFVSVLFNENELIQGTVNGGAVTVVNRKPSIELELSGSVAIIEGQEFSMAVTGSDLDGQGVYMSVEMSPVDDYSSTAILAAEGGSGTFYWVPDYLTTPAEQSRVYTATFMIEDDLGATSLQSIDIIVVNNNRAPELTDIPNQTVTEGKLLTIPVDASDPDGDPLYLRVSPLPDNAAVDKLTFNWQPNQNQVGEHMLYFTVYDRNISFKPTRESDLPMSAMDSAMVTVVDTNYAPVFTPISDASVNAGATFRLVARAGDPDGDAVTYSDDTDLFDIGATTGEVTFVPTTQQVGEYEITITATDANQASSTETFLLSVIADTKPPQYVLGLPTAVNPAQTSISIVWNTNELSTSVVRYGIFGGALADSVKNTSLVTSHKIDLTGLLAGTKYSFQVISRDASGNSSIPYSGTFQTESAGATVQPVAISNLSASPGTNTATISWKTNVYANGRVQYGVTKTSLTSSAQTAEQTDAPKITLTGLNSLQKYYYRVTATQSATNIATSAIDSFRTTTVLRPPVISNVKITSKGDSSFTVQWETGRFASSILEWGPSSAYGSQIVRDDELNGGVKLHSITAVGLEPSSEYHFRVGSLGAEQLGAAISGPSYSADFIALTEATPDVLPPVFVEGPTRTSATHQQATIYWKTDESASYVIRWGVTPTSGAEVTFTSEVSRTTDFALSHSHTLTGLTANTNYTVEVSVYDTKDNGPISRRTRFTTKATPDVTNPRILGEVAVESITDEGATITWTTDEAATSVVDYLMAGETTESRVSDATLTTDHEVRLSGLESDTRYSITVFSVDGSDNASDPVATTFRTRPVPDTTPPTITAFPSVEGQTLTDSGRVNVRLTLGTNERTSATVRYWVNVEALSQLPATSSATVHSITFPNLMPSTRYYYQITLLDDSDNKTTDQVRSFLTVAGKDNRPPKFTVAPVAANITNNSFTVQWTTDEAASAELTVRSGQDIVATLSDATPRTVNQIAVTNLTANTQYSWVLVVADQSGNTSTTGRKQTTTLPVPDTTPPVFTQQPAVTYSASDRAVMTWVTDEKTVGEVYYAAEGAEYFFVAYDKRTYKRSHTITLAGLDAGANYLYFVRALDAATPPNATVAGDSSATEFDDVQIIKLANGMFKITQPDRSGLFGTSSTPDGTAPQFTSAPEVSNSGTNDATLEWGTDETSDSRLRVLPSDSVDAVASKLTKGAATYDQIADSLLLADGRQISSSAFVTQHQLTVTELNPSTQYVLHVASLDPSSNGETISNVIYFTTASEVDLTPPTITSGSITVAPSQTQASVSWATNELATSLVRYGVGSDEQNWLSQSIEDATTQHSVVLTNLAAGTEYSYRVYSTDTRENGPTASAVATFTTEATADVTAPVFSVTPSAITKTDKTATIEWTTDEPAATFIEWGTDVSYGFSFNDPTLKTSHRVTLTGLSLNTQYHYKAVATDQASNQAESADLTVTTNAVADTEGPDAPASVVTVLGSESVTLRWLPSASVDAESYTVYRDGTILQNAIKDTQFTDVSVTNDVQYSYEVSATDVVSNEGVKTSAVNATPSASEAPTAPAVVSPSGGSTVGTEAVTLVVSNATRATSRPNTAPTYSFVVATDENLQTIVATTSGVTEGTGSTSWAIDGNQFDTGASYYWAVLANDGVVSGPLSDVVAFSYEPSAIQLTTFAAEGSAAGLVHVSWEFNAGRESLQSIELLRGSSESSVDLVKAFGPEGTSGEVIDAGVVAGQTPNYWLRITETSGVATTYGPVSATLAIPERWAMTPAYPNPFNPTTEVLLSVPETGEASVVVYNILGQPVHTLWAGQITPGVHKLVWNGRDNTGRQVGSGVYVIRAHSKTGVNIMRRVTMIR